jgi:hypothetical protein
MSETLSVAFARRIAERDNPPPPPPLSQEPAAVQARVEAWLLATHGMRNKRGRLRQRLMLLALMQHLERHTAQLAEAVGLPARAAARVAVRLSEFGLITWEYRSLYRYWRLTRTAEDALLLVVQGSTVRAPQISNLAAETIAEPPISAAK